MDNAILNGDDISIDSIISLLEKQRLSGTDFTSKIDRVLTIQFLEYAATHLVALSGSDLSTIDSILKEVNEMLSDKVYLLGCKKTVVDVIYYRMIFPVMSKLSICDKEGYVHVSRWFNHLQNDDSIRQSKPFVAFNRTLLYA